MRNADADVVLQQRLRAARERALDALAQAGIPQEAVVLGRFQPGSQYYETHVGNASRAAKPKDHASFLGHITRDLSREAEEQAQAMYSDVTCPSCGSTRVPIRRRRRDPRPGQEPGVYVDVFDACMDCDWEGPPR